MAGSQCEFNLFHFFVLTLLSLASALIPRPCRHNLTHADATCCPTPKGRKLPCGGPGFGRCQRFRVHHDIKGHFSKLTLADDRFDWPTRFFTHGCHCEGNRWGFACQDCWFGWTGPYCRKKEVVVVRKNMVDYSPKEKETFREVLQKLYETPSEDYVFFDEKDNTHLDPLNNPQIIDNITILQYLVFLHRYSSRTTLYSKRSDCFKNALFDFSHNGATFLTWHRLYLRIFEREGAKIAKQTFKVDNFSLPYWDWTDATNCDVCTDDMIGNLKSKHNRLMGPSPFGKWKVYCEPPFNKENLCVGCHTLLNMKPTWPKLWRIWKPKAKLPTKAQVDFAISRPYFFIPNSVGVKNCSSFSNAVEGTCQADDSKDAYVMHNGVHDAFHGPFSTSGASPNDPFFLLHHIQLDRVFSAWFRRQQPNVPHMPNVGVSPGHCRDCNMAAFIPPVANKVMMVDTRALGYDYDNLKFGKERK